VTAIVAAFGIYRNVDARADEEESPELQTSVVRRGDLVMYASGTGTLVAGTEVDLGFGTNGPISEILVQVGDEVQEGDVLAIQGDLDQLEAAVATDALSVLNAQEALDEIRENAALVTAEAMLTLADAQEALEDAEWTRSVQQEGNRASQVTINNARAGLTLAEAALERAKAKYDNTPGNRDEDSAKAAAYTDYANAQQQYDSALRSYNWYTGSPSETEQAQLDAEVALAEAQLTLAEIAWEQVKDGPDPDELEKAELQLANTQAQLAVSERNLSEATILAPFDGTVMAISANVGDIVSGPFITLAELSQPYLEIFLDETDLDTLEIGNEIEVVFDAIPEVTFTGHLIQVDPGLTTTNNVTFARGTAVLDSQETPSPVKLLVGMNAAVDVIGGRAENVILVPIEALRELSPGEYAVFVIENGEPVLRLVEVGLMDFSFAEINSGLNTGEAVSTGIVEVE
jgi:multidrug efflux pump subunit AcrA (membrane-fusion protein)